MWIRTITNKNYQTNQPTKQTEKQTDKQQQTASGFISESVCIARILHFSLQIYADLDEKTLQGQGSCCNKTQSISPSITPHKLPNGTCCCFSVSHGSMDNRQSLCYSVYNKMLQWGKKNQARSSCFSCSSHVGIEMEREEFFRGERVMWGKDKIGVIG